MYEIAQRGNVPISNVVAFDDDTLKYGVDYFVSRKFRKLRSHAKVPIMRARPYLSVPWAKMLPLNIIRTNRFNIHIKNGEDSLFMLQISDKIDYFVTTTDAAIYYRRIRAESAVSRKKSLMERLTNDYYLMSGYLTCLLRPWKYNFVFVLTRIAALFVTKK